MEGVRAYDCSEFHRPCAGVTVIDVGGFAHLWCPACRVYANLEAVSPKFQNYARAKVPAPLSEET